MKIMKSLVAVALLLALCLSLVACSVSKEDVVGTWTGSWTYNGNSYVEAIVLSENGTYASAMYKNGSYYKTETGTYEISGRRVELHPNGEKGHTTPYEYKGGKLVNNDHEFTKK